MISLGSEAPKCDEKVAEGFRLCCACQHYAGEVAQKVACVESGLSGLVANVTGFPSVSNMELLVQQYDVLVSMLRAQERALLQANASAGSWGGWFAFVCRFR